MKNKNTCIIPNCNRPAKCRGVCGSHYVNISRLIRAKRVPKWKTLEKHGRVLPTTRKYTGRGTLQAYLLGKL